MTNEEIHAQIVDLTKLTEQALDNQKLIIALCEKTDSIAEALKSISDAIEKKNGFNVSLSGHVSNLVSKW